MKRNTQVEASSIAFLINSPIVIIFLFILLTIPLTIKDPITMDLADTISSRFALKQFIKESFKQFASKEMDPFFIYRRNLQLKKDKNMTFCGMNVIDGWAYQETEHEYYLYLRVKQQEHLNRLLTTYFGEPVSEFSISVNESGESTSYMWASDDLSIFWIEHLSFVERSQNPDILIMIGNMELRRVIGPN